MLVQDVARMTELVDDNRLERLVRKGVRVRVSLLALTR